MWSRKKLKESARISFRHNYWRCIIMCVILSFTTGIFTSPVTVLQEAERRITDILWADENNVMPDARPVPEVTGEDMAQNAREGEKSNTDILREMLDGIEKRYVKNEDEVVKKYEGAIGFFANHIDSSDSFVYGVINALNQLFFRGSVGASVIILTGVLISILVWIFLKNILRLGGQRFFLENHRYYSTDLKRIFLPFRVRNILNQAKIMLLKSVYQILWCFTIAGAFIKPYSYLMVPYITAENPSVDSKTVFRLSRQMMNGNKWRAFVMRLSFLPWEIANLVTLGLVDFFYLNAYRTSAFTELYFELRREAINVQIPGYEVFIDRYLDPQEDDERIVVSGYIVNPYQTKPTKRVYYKLHTEDDGTRKTYDTLSPDMVAVGMGADYRDDLFPLPLRGNALIQVEAVRDYSVLSYLQLFFTFSIIGWVWEVTLHLFTEGEFVNRGTMFGPWLPIYGVGGTMALILLHRHVKKPMSVFLASFVMSGVIEYFTATYLWYTRHMKWWDYTGNFMNVQGRICLEGLLLFAAGCMVILYFVGPNLDELYMKIDVRIRMAVIAVLIVLFLCDFIYSHSHPNIGEGITSAFLRNALSAMS